MIQNKADFALLTWKVQFCLIALFDALFLALTFWYLFYSERFHHLSESQAIQKCSHCRALKLRCISMNLFKLFLSDLIQGCKKIVYVTARNASQWWSKKWTFIVYNVVNWYLGKMAWAHTLKFLITNKNFWKSVSLQPGFLFLLGTWIYKYTYDVRLWVSAPLKTLQI